MPIDVPDSSTEAAEAPNGGDVANKSFGTDIPISKALAAAFAVAPSFLVIDCDRDGMGMGIEDILELDNCVLNVGLEDDDDDDDSVVIDSCESTFLAAAAASICSPMLLN